MPCGGYNHSPSCECPFGNPRGSVRRVGERSKRTPSPSRGVKQSRPHTCRCGATVYGVWPCGGGFFWATSVDPLTQHICDYTRRIGKLRIGKSHARAEGWLPFQIATFTFEGTTARLSAVSIPLGLCVVEIEDADGLVFPGTPMFRQVAIDDSVVELASRDELSGELTPLQFLGRVLKDGE